MVEAGRKAASSVICTTRLDNTELVLNCDLIEHIDATPDTVITLINGKKWVVRESIDEIIRRVVEYHRSVGRSCGPAAFAAIQDATGQGGG
ncbi:MAG: flagellar FlbD family protein [Chloroflexi bacterium]|nr:flagellar FlbD family protein [Chloroflexota bacterium]